MTVDALRERLQAALARSHRRQCPHCAGSGQVNAPIPVVEIADELKMPAHTLTRFLNGKGGLRLDQGLHLVAILDRLDDPLIDLDDEDDDAVDEELENKRQAARSAASSAAATAGIDSINRPLKTRPPS